MCEPESRDSVAIIPIIQIDKFQPSVAAWKSDRSLKIVLEQGLAVF